MLRKLYNRIASIIKWFFGSMDNTKHGASGRKLSAFACILFTGYVVKYHTTNENATTMASIMLTGACVFLGLVTIPELIKILKGKQEPNLPDQQTPPAP